MKEKEVPTFLIILSLTIGFVAILGLLANLAAFSTTNPSSDGGELLDLFRGDRPQLIEELTSNDSIAADINRHEFLFREELSQKIYENINRLSHISDSSKVFNKTEEGLLIKFLVLRFFELDSLGKTYEINISNSKDGVITKYENIYLNLSVDKNKIIAFIDYKSSITDIRDFLKFGNYTKSTFFVQTSLKTDRALLVLGGIVFFISIFFIIKSFVEKKPSLSESEKTVEEGENAVNNAKQQNQKTSDIIEKKKIQSLIKELNNLINNFKTEDNTFLILKDDVNKISIKTRELYNRSNWMLVLGLTMSMIDVLVFYLSLPSESISSSTNYLIVFIRPALILVFIQGISWYLLRQYRVLIEDYKYFQKQYEKRANYLTCYSILKGDKISQEKLIFVMSLIKDDLSGKLKSDETTEQIENIKQIEKSPFSETINMLIEKINFSK